MGTLIYSEKEMDKSALTYRFLSLIGIPTLCASALADLPIRFIIAWGFSFVIAAIASLKEDNED